MRNRFSQLYTQLALSSLKLRIIAGALMIVGGVLVYLARREPELPLTRVYIPNAPAQITYIWQMILVAALFFLTGLTALILSFLKKA